MNKRYHHALCLHPYYRDSRSGSLGLAVFPPIGLEYIAAALEPLVDRVTLVDLRQSGPYRNRKRLQRLVESEIDLLCIGINWEYHFEETCRLVAELPAGITTVVGGKQATEYADEIFAACPNVDIIVKGEGEETIAAIARGEDWSQIEGLAYRRDGRVIHNQLRPFPDVNTVLHPDRSLRRSKYQFNLSGFAMSGEEFDIILTARGCPHNCKFCTFALGPDGKKRNYADRPIDSVIDELKQMTAGVVLISDENFFVNPRRAKELCDRIVAEGIKKRFLVQARIEIYKRPEVLEAAVAAGIKLLLLGVESPTDRILQDLGKGFDTAELERAFEVFNQYPFYCHGYFIYGNVNETEEEMLQIPVFAKKLGLDSITYQKLRAEKYSPVHDLVAAAPDYFVGDDHTVYHRDLLRPGLVRISKKITRRFYTPARLVKIVYRLLRLGLLRPRNLPPLLMSLPVLTVKILGREVYKTVQRRRIRKQVAAMKRAQAAA